MVASTLYVSGKFDAEGGKESKIGRLMFEAMHLSGFHYLNGGHFQLLQDTLEHITDYQLIFWFADVPNDQPKLIREIKERNKACVLVTSKRNLEGEYSFQDLLYHALGNKSNLIVEFTKEAERYLGRVIDPLGNVFLDHEEDFGLVAQVLEKRADEIMHYTRMPSSQVPGEKAVPDQPEFFSLVRDYAAMFHQFIHAHPDATNRFFGNASFRCEHGFPSFAQEGMLFVSQRNIDKRIITPASFVPVKPVLPIQYFGESKPSVDTPIHIRLYRCYPKARFMLHAHTYIENAPFTSTIIPCGALEEADAIHSLFPEKAQANFAINLKGHGSLVISDNLESLKEIPYRAREMPEIHPAYRNL